MMKKSRWTFLILTTILAVSLIASLTPSISATVLFSDGFETGDLSKWSTNGGNCAVGTSPVFRGVYAAQLGNWIAWINKTLISGYATLYVRVYFRFHVLPSLASQTVTFLEIWGGGMSGAEAVKLKIVYATDHLVLRMTSTTPYYVDTDYSYSFAVDTWYEAEVECVKASGTGGAYHAWLNGVDVCDYAGIDTSSLPNLDTLQVGVMYYAGWNDVVYIDNVVISTAYIGLASSYEIALLTQFANTTIRGNPCLFSAKWQSYGSYLTQYRFGSNNTGTWINDTWTSFPSSETTGWSNITKTLSSSPAGTKVQWQIWANNAAGNSTTTSLQTISLADFVAAQQLLNLDCETAQLIVSGAYIPLAQNVNSTGSTDVETGIALYDTSSTLRSNLAVIDYAGSRTWIETGSEVTPHSGSRCIGLCSGPSGSSVRCEWELNHLDGSGGTPYVPSHGPPYGFNIVKDYYFSVWLYFPSDWNLTQPVSGWSWYELMNPFVFYDFSGYFPRTCLHIHRYPDGHYDLVLHYDNVEGETQEISWTLLNPFDLSTIRGKWTKWSFFAHRTTDYTTAYMKMWLNDEPLNCTDDGSSIFSDSNANLGPTDRSYHLRTKGISTNWIITFAKSYTDGNGKAHYLWFDDLQLYTDIPETSGLSVPSISDSTYSTTTTGENCLFSAQCQDDVGLLGYKFSWNGTGSWINSTWISLSGHLGTATDTETLPTNGIKIAFQWYCENTLENWATSDVSTFTVTLPPIIPVVPTVGNNTLYFRGDSWTINKITAYELRDSESSSGITITQTAIGNQIAYYGFAAYILHPDGSLTQFTGTTPNTLVTLSSNTSISYKTGYCTMPQTSFALGFDALSITLYIKLGSGSWYAVGQYITQQIMSKQLLAQTWAFNLLVSDTITTSTTATLKFGGDYKSSVSGVGFKVPYTQEIQVYYWQVGDLINAIFYGYFALFGQTLFFGILLFMGCSTMYVKYRNFAPILMLFILFGTTGGLVWAFIPGPALFVVWILLMVGFATLLFRVLR